MDLDQQRKDSKGYPRYYSTPLEHHRLLFSSQWNYDRHYEDWTRLLQAAGLIQLPAATSQARQPAGS